MLRKILSITGKPGLYKVVSQAKSSVIVESLLDQKRMPVLSREKAISLGDIALYTVDEEEPLHKVFTAIFVKEEGRSASIDPKASYPQLCEYLEIILPSFDRSRVYASDIKKLIVWYNCLVNAGYTSFEPEAKDTETVEEAAE